MIGKPAFKRQNLKNKKSQNPGVKYLGFGSYKLWLNFTPDKISEFCFLRYGVNAAKLYL